MACQKESSGEMRKENICEAIFENLVLPAGYDAGPKGRVKWKCILSVVLAISCPK
jgi:hypothetical protein